MAKVESPMIDILADDASTGEGIDMLIGNDLYFSFIRKSVDLGNNTFLVDSDFGWFLAGSATNSREGETLSVATYCQCHEINQDFFTEPDLPLRTIDVKFLWSLESIGICDSPKTTCEEEAVQHFNKTVKYSEGRYQVKWPWIEYPPKLPTNFGLAFGRLKGVIRRSNKEVMTEYEKILNEQLQANIIEIVDPTIPADHPVHYLPFHMVQQKGKRGRLVYDASAKLKNEKSLNECLYRGPNMLEDLTGLILKFRIGKIAITADVEKAFLQVGLQEEDRDVTRFLWVKDLEKELSEDNIMQYRFCRVPFGVISSPFLLAATIRYHISKTNKSLLPVIADKCYVDNLVTSVQSREEALNLYAQTTNSFKELGMNIRDWMSNDKDFVDKIPKLKRAKQESEMKILGLIWNLENDTLRLKLNNETFESEITDRGITKKGVLRVLARLYDPCGFVSPLMLPGKLLFQEICTRKLKWDEILPEDLLTSWRNIIENLKVVKNVELPRHVASGSKSECTKYELHCFTDASMDAYAAVVYLRVITGKQVSTSFLMSKSRITPAEDKSDLKIPRLELLGYLIGSRLLRYVKSHIDLNICKIYLWTDSQVVIAWIKSSRLLPPFVLRRVNEIKQIKDILGAELRYVNSKENPADVATRPELWHHRQDLWLHGPDFLLQDQNDWPKEQRYEEMCLAGRALDTVDGPEMTMKGYEDQDNDPNFSEMEDNPAATALHDSVQNPSDEEKCEETVTEIKKLQGKFFSEEVSGKVTSLSRNLGLFVDEDGILRCKGRFANANLSYDKRYPILIPKKSPFTTQIILKTHRDNYHVGVPHTLSILREKYWIPHGRAQVQKALKRCLQCEKYSGGPYKLPPPPALPSERVNYSSPFTFTGLDYLGPVLVETNTGREKRWICLMTCLAVRAVHLELVKALTAEECLLAIRRFVAARGPPKVLISDNALQFKLTSEVLIHSYCQEKHIKWKFITQLAPWQGGFYERLVALVKHCLKRTLDKHLLTDGQMHTVVKEIEAVLNTRPLTVVGSDPEGVLRPADFLSLGQCLEINPDFGEGTSQGTNTKVDLVEGWKRGQRILNEYKEMFTNQYLPSLRDRFSHSHKQPRVISKKSPEVGDIVQIKNDSKNRINWKVGKIVSLIRSRDGECRAAKVVVGNTEFTRSIAHLYPLESDMYGPTDYALPPSQDNEMAETSTVPMEMVKTMEPIRASETIVSPKPETEIDESTIPTEPATEKEISVLDSDGSPTHTEQAPAVDTYEAEVREPSVTEERPEEVTRVRRNAAIWARERIAEWTRQLMTLLV
ncbi:uncharacterized protein LOC133521744 [Cydia pomonella]|uniref:uncharacterized protein LOC133521744 n=1 Tax=Cydia pomonella TaxID=82600 RepID=UPI002ADE6F83|nr:uncharacterized protein LOC133521744 [Cydia pomonella]